jgi:hypothetical protein
VYECAYIIVVGQLPNSENFQYHQPTTTTHGSSRANPKKWICVCKCASSSNWLGWPFHCSCCSSCYMIPLPRYFPLGYYDELEFSVSLVSTAKKVQLPQNTTNTKKNFVYPSIVLFEKKEKPFPFVSAAVAVDPHFYCVY